MKRGIVMDGRDIGTVVFPDYNAILDNLRNRDRNDCTRSDSPLKKADDAYEIDTSNLIFEDQIRIIINKATGIISSLTKI